MTKWSVLQEGELRIGGPEEKNPVAAYHRGFVRQCRPMMVREGGGIAEARVGGGGAPPVSQ